MQEWIEQSLGAGTVSVPVVAAAFVFGLLGAVSACCNVVVIGAIAGYSGSQSEKRNTRDILVRGLFFMLGAIIALGALGAVTGFISQTVGALAERYWRLFAGFVLVAFGLLSLNLVRFKLPKFGSAETAPTGFVKAMVYGLAIGGGTTACTAGCNPVLAVVLGAVALQGRTSAGAVILAVFAVGYSLPLAGVMVGLELGFSKLASVLQKFATAIRVVAGVMLIGFGIYLLGT